MDAQAILTLLLGSGGALFIGALFTGIRALQSGANQKVRESIVDLAKLREDAEKRLEKSEDERSCAERQVYEWRAYAGALEYALNSHGMAIPNYAKRPEHRG